MMAAKEKTAEDQARAGQADAEGKAAGTAAAAAPKEGGQVAERASDEAKPGHVKLPFVPVQLRAPGRADLDSAAHWASSVLPSGKSLWFLGGLAATAVVGVIEWPVAAAIGVGTALASRTAGEQQGGSAGTASAEGQS